MKDALADESMQHVSCARRDIATVVLPRFKLKCSRGFVGASLGGLLLLALVCNAQDQNRSITVTPNYRGTDVWQAVEALAAVVQDSRVVFDPNVRGRITLTCAVPLSPLALRDVMRVVLRANGLELTESINGVGLKRIALANSQMPLGELSAGESTAVRVAHITSTQGKDVSWLMKNIRQRLSPVGQVSNQQNGSLLIIVDQKENIDSVREFLGEVSRW